MSLKIKSSILDNLKTTLDEILIAEGYTVDVRIVSIIALPTEKFDAEERQALIEICIDNEEKFRAGEHEKADDLLTSAMLTFLLRVSMDNTTPQAFSDFLEDIEAAVSKDETRGSECSDYHYVHHTFIKRIDWVTTEEQNIERIQEAIMTLIVNYTYIPLMLSGDAERLG